MSEQRTVKITVKSFHSIKKLAENTGITQQKLIDIAVSEFLERAQKQGTISIPISPSSTKN